MVPVRGAGVRRGSQEELFAEIDKVLEPDKTFGSWKVLAAASRTTSDLPLGRSLALLDPPELSGEEAIRELCQYVKSLIEAKKFTPEGISNILWLYDRLNATSEVKHDAIIGLFRSLNKVIQDEALEVAIKAINAEQWLPNKAINKNPKTIDDWKHLRLIVDYIGYFYDPLVECTPWAGQE